MNKSDYDKYYKKGGTYVIPVEVFNELFDELERLNKARKFDIEYNKYLQKGIIRLNNIINELKKYIEDTKQDGYKLVWINEYKNYFEAGIEEILGSDKE